MNQTMDEDERMALELFPDIPSNARLDKPWPLRDVLAKLVEAAEILLHRCDYDGHGYEEILAAVDAAKKITGAAE